jgi:acyl carrier protein
MDHEEISLKKLQLILLIEESYNIKITNLEIESIETIEDLVKLISKKLGY